MHKLLTFFRLPRWEKLLYFKVLFFSGLYRWQLLRRPFKELAPVLGELGEQACSCSAQDRAFLVALRRAVKWVCKYTPWKSECLVQAMTVMRILRDKGIPANAYLGVRRGENGELLAHAWTKCGEFYVSGAAGSQLFTVTSIFHS